MMAKTAALVVACTLSMASAFWPGECGFNPGEWALDDNKELDCALRKLSLERSVQGERARTVQLRNFQLACQCAWGLHMSL